MSHWLETNMCPWRWLETSFRTCTGCSRNIWWVL